eukprot:3449780-Rhodomonas_salina.4
MAVLHQASQRAVDPPTPWKGKWGWAFGRSHPGAIPEGYLRGQLSQVRAWTFTTRPNDVGGTEGFYGGASCEEAREGGGGGAELQGCWDLKAEDGKGDAWQK